MTFRAERTFKIRITRDWGERLGIRKAGDDVTLGQYHAFLLRLCREQNVEPPPDSWNVLRRVVTDATGVDADELTPQTWLIRDCAPDG